MGELRKPFLILALLVIVVATLLETGTALVAGGGDPGAQVAAAAAGLGLDPGAVHGAVVPSGRGVPSLALIDVIVVFTAGLFVLSLLLPRAVQGRLQGVATLIGALALIGVATGLLLSAVAELTLMVTLFLAVPFGTLAYLIKWGFFPAGDLQVLLGLLLFLKLVFGTLLVLAQPGFLRNKGLVALVATSVLSTVALSFVYGFVPSVLGSIADAAAAVVLAAIAVVWGVVLLIGSVPAMVRALRR